MTHYQLTALDDWQEPGADASPYVRFQVGEGEAIGQVMARATGRLQSLGTLEGIDWRCVLGMAVLDEAETRLALGLLSREAGASLTLTYDSNDETRLAALANSPKRCHWQRPVEPRGHLCLATGPADSPEPTTLALCESCELPDARLICSALVHPHVEFQGSVGVYSPDGDGYSSHPRRFVKTAFCELNVREQGWNNCQPHGRECWHRVVGDGTRNPRPSEQAPRGLIDEVPYLRLVYGDRFGVRPSEFWPTIDERATATILSGCTTAMDFQQHVSSLDALVTRMNPLPQLDEADRVDAAGRRIGSLSALALVLEKRCAGAALTYMDRLRALHKARSSFPAHPRSDDLASSLRTLGVKHFPPGDWRLAWWQVAASVAEALAAIRTAIQTTNPDDDV